MIGADGARSVVRRALVGGSHPQRFMTLEVLTEEDSDTTPEFTDNMAVFDFRGAPEGLRGYAWDFPSLRGHTALMNRGIGGTEWPRARSLKSAFAAHLAGRGVGLSTCSLQGAAVPLYHPATPQSAERVVLAGDAVGVDPLMGEGISVAIGTGMLAGHAVVDAFASGNFDFSDYRGRVAASSVGWVLRRNCMSAGLFYRRLREGGSAPFPSQGLQ